MVGLFCDAEFDAFELANGDVFAGFSDVFFNKGFNGFRIVQDVGLGEEDFVGEGFFHLTFNDLSFHFFWAFKVLF